MRIVVVILARSGHRGCRIALISDLLESGADALIQVRKAKHEAVA